MKSKRKRILKPITEERILQLSNDHSEGIKSGTLREWKAVAQYHQNEHTRMWNELGTMRCHIAALVASWDIHNAAAPEIRKWLRSQTPQSTA